jgi:hypothetical protein
MKRLFHAVILCCLGWGAPTHAQLQKGGKYFAGTLTLDGSNTRPQTLNVSSSGRFNRISVNPSLQAGRFISENRMIGIEVGSSMQINWGKNYSPDGSISHYRGVKGAYNLSPYIRHYKPLHTKWALFLTSSADLAYLKTIEKRQQEKRNLDGYSAGLNVVPGIVFRINPRFALESDINLLSLSTGYRAFDGDKSFYLTSSVTTGIQSYFSLRAAWYIHKL